MTATVPTADPRTAHLTHRPAHAMRRLPALAAVALALAATARPQLARAQDAPAAVPVPAVQPLLLTGVTAPIDTVARIYACHVPTTGTMYRIRVAGTPAGCAAGHVELWWSRNGLTLPYTPPDASALGPLVSLRNQGTGANSHGAAFHGNVATGVRGTSQAGAGVHGYAATAKAVGVRAEAYDQKGAALDIARGGIRVAGAGRDTPTAALIMNMGCGEARYIDNPLANGRPGAMIFATARGSSADEQLVSASVAYDGAAGKWMLKTNNQWAGTLNSLCGRVDVNVLIVNN